MNAPREELPDAIWVISDVMPDGTYGAVIHFNYHRLLTEHLGLDDQTARAVVNDLGSFFTSEL